MLTGDKVRLRAVEPSDAAYMYDVENDTDSWISSDSVAPMSACMLRDYAENYDADPIRAGQLRLMAEEISGGNLVGIVDLYRISATDRHAFVGVYVSPAMRGKGFGRDMISIVTRYAREMLCMHQLLALVTAGNQKSRRLFCTCGYEHTATLKGFKRSRLGYEDVMVFQYMPE